MGERASDTDAAIRDRNDECEGEREGGREEEEDAEKGREVESEPRWETCAQKLGRS